MLEPEKPVELKAGRGADRAFQGSTGRADGQAYRSIIRRPAVAFLRPFDLGFVRQFLERLAGKDVLDLFLFCLDPDLSLSFVCVCVCMMTSTYLARCTYLLSYPE